MKKIYFFFLIFTIYLHSNGQVNCTEANSDVVYGYSHLKTANEASNLENLKQWSDRSLKSFIQVSTKLKICMCEKSYDNATNIVKLLSQVEKTKSFQDGQLLIKKARGVAKNVVKELNICIKSEKFSSR